MLASLVVLAGGLSLPGRASAAPTSCATLQTLSLQPGNVPAGFFPSRSSGITMANFAREEHVPSSLLRRSGYVGAFDAYFVRSGAQGITALDNTIAAFKTAGGARQGYESWARSMRSAMLQLGRGSAGSLSAPGLGDQESGSVSQMKVNKNGSLTADLLMFRRGAYVSSLIVVGRAHLNRNSLVGLARIIDRRLQTAKAKGCPRS